MSQCPNCGRPLAEGEVCSCINEVKEAVNVPQEQETPVEMPARETPVEAPVQEAPYAAPQPPVYAAPVPGAPYAAPPQGNPYATPYQAARQENPYTAPQGNPYATPYQAAGQENPYAPPYGSTADGTAQYVPAAETPPRTDYPAGYKPKRKYAACILALLLGLLGIHNFYLGYRSKALAQLLICTLGSFVFGIGAIAALIWALIDFAELLIDKQDRDADGFKIQTFEEALVAERMRAEAAAKEEE